MPKEKPSPEKNTPKKQKPKCRFKVFLAIILTTAVLGGIFYVWYQYFSGIGEYSFVETEKYSELKIGEEIKKALEEAEKETEEPKKEEEKETEAVKKPIENPFELEAVSEGDQIADMKIKSIKPFNENYEISYYNVIIDFTGENIIEAEYKYIPQGDGIIQDNVCFEVKDEESLEKIPRLKEDTNRVFFCASNSDFAKEQFAPEGSEGTARIIIDNYKMIEAEAEVWDTTELVKVREKY
ncbi:hypothetical protein GF366_00070 [Candidatus Peregrinibacteria bacterium]|nr:hypothetical protein [Candidatus Peregrinibacteria bacterium]